MTLQKLKYSKKGSISVDSIRLRKQELENLLQDKNLSSLETEAYRKELITVNKLLFRIGDVEILYSEEELKEFFQSSFEDLKIFMFDRFKKDVTEVLENPDFIPSLLYYFDEVEINGKTFYFQTETYRNS